MQLKDTEKVVLVDSGFASTTDSLQTVWGLGVGSQIFDGEVGGYLKSNEILELTVDLKCSSLGFAEKSDLDRVGRS